VSRSVRSPRPASPPPPPLEWVRPPRQARSHRTLERLLDAAEEVITAKGTERATVAEIARRAGSSVGAFYARFPDKEALLRVVLERFFDQATATIEAVLEPERWAGATLAEMLEACLGFTVGVFRDRRPLIAACAVRSAADPALRSVSCDLGELVAARMNALLVRRGERPGHPRPAEAVRLATWLVLGALEARALHGPGGGPDVADEVLAAELARVCLAYLELDR
jgi:AcrR family transcriptional regulator